MTIIELVLLRSIPWHSTEFQSTQQHSKVEYKKPLCEKKVAANLLCIVLCILIIKTTTFMYEIKHLDPLIENNYYPFHQTLFFPKHCTEM
jgi:hypothetical protein